MESKQIGDINGGWSVVFRLSLATYPIALTAIIGFASWVVVQINEIDRFRIHAMATYVSHAELSLAQLVNEEAHALARQRLSLVELMIAQTSGDSKRAADAAMENRQMLLQLVKPKVP